MIFYVAQGDVQPWGLSRPTKTLDLTPRGVELISAAQHISISVNSGNALQQKNIFSRYIFRALRQNATIIADSYHLLVGPAQSVPGI